MTRTPLVVAVDGPSGSGKSSVSRQVAAQLDLAYLDTGAMYRAATWRCVQRGVDLMDTALVADTVRSMVLQLDLNPRFPSFVVDGVDVGVAIRAPEISAVVSQVATNLEVRADLGERQRRVIAVERTPDGFSGGRGIVVEGRDITTVIAPDADVRLLLTASEEARLARRAREVHGTDDAAALEATREHVVDRDARDSTVVEFRTAADGVVTVDSSGLDLEQTVQAVLALVEDVAGR
ncbi:(d)CMP kinase [Isoptericola sp. b441]|uniref:Cytidylate kinase n=1 Tax=Actinotalea lenta TaxID=3064654 RepID=A0ABT9D9V6_9CELL|nr:MULTISPECIES: (d)CMP kinase [unclassified Isoptericola]MDO8107689.1 (d)CMP kinase [Isoptericola sp. b441]MDO8120651.1 (d)CMP kinase [Isoptericola sp. b490]